LDHPNGGGLHTKRVLGWVDGEPWSAMGSLDGSEISYKVNREVVLLVDHPLVYARLRGVFLHDWTLATRSRQLSHVCPC
jgi:hypothetical protein